MAVARTFGKSSVEAAEREMSRLAALERLDILDTPKDEGFERIVRLVKQIFSVDIGIVSMIDAHRQWYKACSGLTNEEVPRQDSFCQYVIDKEEAVVVQDASRDVRFAGHPAVTGPMQVRFYAGIPIRTRDGFTVGTLCAIDSRPRSFSSRDLGIGTELADAVMDRIELLRSASTDGLTEVLTRRAFKDEAEQVIALALRHQHDISCVTFDIDHFKKINDSFGHAAGDEVLRQAVAACRSVLRAGDPFGRLGGEEFAILLPHVGRDGAAATAEKLRAAIADRKMEQNGQPLQVTASFGISTMSIVARDIESLLAQADAAMYQAKNAGRDRCIAWASAQGDQPCSARRRVLKAGQIVFNNRHSTIDCTIRTLGADGAGLSVSSSAGIPPDFVLVIRGEGFETKCRVVAQERQHIEVAFG